MKSTVTEKAPPGEEDFILKAKKSFKKRYGKKKGLNYLYATAWKRHNQESVNGSDLSFQKFVEEYQPGDTFVKVGGKLGAVTSTSEDGKLVHVTFVDGGKGMYHSDKIEPVHKSSQSKSKEPYMHLKYGAMDENTKLTEAFEEGMLVKVIGNVVGKDIEGYIKKVSPSGEFCWVQLRNGDVNAYHRSDIQAYDPSPDEEDDDSEYGFEKGNNAETTVEPWAYEDDPRNPYNDSVQVERRDDDDEENDDDYVYNAAGKYVGPERGTHDAGGHPSGEKLADRADYLSNFYKDESVKVESTQAEDERLEAAGWTKRSIHSSGTMASVPPWSKGNQVMWQDWTTGEWIRQSRGFHSQADRKVYNTLDDALQDDYTESLQTESMKFQKWIDSVKKLFADGIPSHGLLGLMREGLIDKNEIRRAYKLGLTPDAALRYLISDLHLASTKKDFKTITESVVNYLDNSQPGFWYTFGEKGPIFEYRARNKNKVISLPSRNFTGKVFETKNVDNKWFVRLENKVDPSQTERFNLVEMSAMDLDESMDWAGLEARKLISKHNIDLNLFKQWFYRKKQPNPHDQNHYSAIQLSEILKRIKDFNMFAFAIMSEDLYEGTLEDLLQAYLDDPSHVIRESHETLQQSAAVDRLAKAGFSVSKTSEDEIDGLTVYMSKHYRFGMLLAQVDSNGLVNGEDVFTFLKGVRKQRF